MLENPTNIQSNPRLEDLQRRIPVVSDKALIDLVNGIQVSKGILRYKKNRGFFGQVWDGLSGSDRARQLLLDGNLVAGQEALHQWVLELSDSLRISQVGLQATQQSLLEARNAIRSVKKSLDKQETRFQRVIQVISQLNQHFDARFQEIDKRIHRLEVRVAANEDLDSIITAWTAGQTYTNLPWAVSVVLLTREVFSSAVTTYELETGDFTRYRPLLVNKILSHSSDVPKTFFGLADLLDLSSQEMSNEDRFLTAALAEIRSIPAQRLRNTPLLFTIGTALELATLPAEIKPAKPGQCAIALCHANIDSISRATDARDFVTAVVEETANDCLAILAK